MKALHKNGITSVVLRVIIRNASTGARITGLTHASTGLIISTIADNESAATAYTAAGSTIETITTLGTFATPTTNKCRFKEVDATNHPGLYEIQLANTRYGVNNARSMIVTVSGYSGMDPVDSEVQLGSVDLYDSVRAGLTALPNAAAEAAGGLFTRGTGAGQITQDANGRIDVSLKAILGTTLTETSGGLIAAAFKKFFDKATPTGTINSIPDAVAGAANGLFIAGTNAATTVTTALTTTFTGNLTGSVGSVTGAVGSVTGNVGGSVAGSVGSVTGAVGSVTGNVGGNVTGSVGSIASGGISAASFAADAITAAKIAADVGTEIATAVWASATRTLTALGSGVITSSTFGTGAIDANAVASTALDNIATTNPGATVNTWPKMVVWLFRRWAKKHKMVVGAMTMYADDGTTVSSTQTTSDDGTEQIVGPIT